MGFKPFKAITSALKIGGGIVGGILGKESGAAKREAAQQREAYQNQISNARREQSLMNENLQRSQSRVAAGVARGNRSRIRGGIFGESAGNNAVGPRLG